MNERIPHQEQLREDLERVLGETPEPSAELRASVLDYAARRRRRSPAPRWRVPAAAASLVAAAALVILVTRPDVPQPEPAREVARVAEMPAQKAPAASAPSDEVFMRRAPLEGDLNGDGRVNIVDAWRLAHSIESGEGQVDLDADGEGSPDDLDRLMQRIVAVRGGAS